MKSISVIPVAIAMLGAQAAPALAGGGGRPPQAHGTAVTPPLVHKPVQSGQSLIIFGGPRLDQRPDPNYQSLYRPMFSPGATKPGELHPYFRTPREGFGYPAARPSPVYLGNGVYVIPR
jgi:hypothetical protein